MKLADLLPKRSTLPPNAYLTGRMLEAARGIEPGKPIRLESKHGDSYVMMRTEDFEHICELAGLRAKDCVDDGSGDANG